MDLGSLWLYTSLSDYLSYRWSK